VQSKKSETGFSMVEVVVVLAIMVIVATIALITLAPALRSSHADSAASYTLNAMRHTRERAIDERRKYQITFVTNGAAPFAQITILQGNTIVTANGPQLQYAVDLTTPGVSLPNDMHFRAPSPAPPAAPDGQACGQSAAIDFSVTGGACGASTTLTFNPDGSITSGLGGFADGVIYMGRPGDPLATRAVSFFGATGRTKGWRMVGAGAGAWKWSMQ
jgi:prepilin-type N-terminal cleavage/methylation domain-containing protein